ncbi:MAG: hypothetical protein KF745_15120 [Phycisphaeraceae bacterium]|nr:hypothetical protein [Phycisphaeraceae bacterium]
MTSPPMRRRAPKTILAALAGALPLLMGGVPAAPAATAVGVQPATSDPDALLTTLDQIAKALANPAMIPARRDEAIRQAIQTRAALIAAAPDDDRAPTWMLDQAGTLLERLSRDGTEASVLLGIPTSVQREQAHTDAGEAMELVGRAEQAAAASVRRLQERVLKARDSDPAKARAEAHQVEAALSRLIDTEQSLRIPYYRGRAGVVLGSLESPDTGSGRAAREELCRIALASLGQLSVGSVAGESVRRVSLGSALLIVALREEKQRANARELFKWVADRPLAGGELGAVDAPDALTRTAALMGLLRAVRGESEIVAAVAGVGDAARQAPFVVQGRTDPLLALLLAEAQCRTMLIEQPWEPSKRSVWLADAFSPLTTLLTRKDLEADRAALRAAVYTKIAAACDLAAAAGNRAVPYEQLDPVIAFAKGASLVAGGGAGNAAATEGVRLLEMVGSRADAEDLRAQALWELAVANWAVIQAGKGDDGTVVLDYLCTLGTKYPNSPRAKEAVLKAVEIARYTIGRLAQAGGTKGSPELAAMLPLYARALELAYTIAPDDPEAPAHRLERARLAIDEASLAGEMTAERLDAALGALEGIRPGTGGATDAQRREGDDLATAAIEAAVTLARTDLARAGDDAARTADRDRLAGVARRAVAWSIQRRPGSADRYRLLLAECLADSRDERALSQFEDLASRVASMTPEDQARVHLGFARALRQSDRAGDAFASLRTLVEGIDRTAAATAASAAPGIVAGGRPPVYWSAWAEMLEILLADNADGKRTQSIRGQIGRLRLIDPSLGGGAATGRIEAVARVVGAAP